MHLFWIKIYQIFFAKIKMSSRNFHFTPFLIFYSENNVLNFFFQNFSKLSSFIFIIWTLVSLFLLVNIKLNFLHAKENFTNHPQSIRKINFSTIQFFWYVIEQLPKLNWWNNHSKICFYADWKTKVGTYWKFGTYMGWTNLINFGKFFYEDIKGNQRCESELFQDE